MRRIKAKLREIVPDWFAQHEIDDARVAGLIKHLRKVVSQFEMFSYLIRDRRHAASLLCLAQSRRILSAKARRAGAAHPLSASFRNQAPHRRRAPVSGKRSIAQARRSLVRYAPHVKALAFNHARNLSLAKDLVIEQQRHQPPKSRVRSRCWTAIVTGMSSGAVLGAARLPQSAPRRCDLIFTDLPGHGRLL